MKKGIALFSTLIILVLVIMLMSLALKNSTNIKQSQTYEKDLTQENLMLSDIKNILDNKVFSLYKSKSQEEKVYILNELIKTPFYFRNPIDNSNIELKIQSSSAKVNLNTLMKFDYQRFRQNLFRKLGIIDIALLEDIIKANLNKAQKNENLVSNEAYKLVFQEVDFYEGEIKSFDEFYKLFDIYVKLSDDIESKAIVWENYIKFSNDDILDINHMPLELIDALPVNFSNETRTILKEKTLLITSENDLKLTSQEWGVLKPLKFGVESNELLCNINIKSINFEVQYKFYYNIKDKKVNNIRMERWNY